MLKVDGLSAAAGSFRLQDIHLTVPTGACHAVLGPSGSGKSTLLNAVLGAVVPTRGTIELAGDDITSWPIERRGIGYVPQQLGLFPHLSVRANLAYGARARRMSPTQVEPLLDRLVEITGIGALLDRYPGTLSGGERQRVALVRAIVASRGLVLLDEPFTALNESLRRELWWLVKELQHDRGMSVLLVTHDLTEAYFLAERITVLIDGARQQSGDKEQIYRHPATVAVARFLGIKNLYSASVVGANLLDCPALGGHIKLGALGGRCEGATCTLGIRSGHVALRAAGDPPRAGEHRLPGRFDAILDLGDDVLLRFKPQGGTGTLEVKLGARVARRRCPQAGAPGVVGLPLEDLIVLES